MKVGQYCKRAVISIRASADVTDAARLMRDEHVGFMVVFDEGDDLRKPVGVLTDRDIVLQVAARDVDSHAVTVGDIMTRQPLTADEHDGLADLLQAMRLAGIRRVPVIGPRGALKGVIATDDVIDLIAGMLGDVAGLIKSEQSQEWRHRSAAP